VAGSSGSSAAVARKELDDLLTNPTDVPLAKALEKLLGGDYDPCLVSELDDPADRAVVATVLHYIDRWFEDEEAEPRRIPVEVDE
jgi:hypothetical protein